MELPGPIARRLVRTAALLWLVSRSVGAVLGVVFLSPLAIGAFVMVVVGLTWIDIEATRERVMYANLAISPFAISVVVGLVAVSLEIVVGAAIAVFAPGLPVASPF